jgi:hypothetical protein
VRAAKLADDDLGKSGIGVFDFYRILQFLFIYPHK